MGVHGCVLRSTALVDAEVPTVAGALRHTGTVESGFAARGMRGHAVAPAGELLVPGDEVEFGMGSVLRTRVVEADREGLRAVLVRSRLMGGWLPGGWAREFAHESVLAGVGHRTLVTASLRWRTPLGVLGRFADVVLLRRFVLASLAHRLGAVRELAEAWAERPVVVGTAIVRDGRLLAQQRAYPASDAGRWELPGGRVDPGEEEQGAVVRECQEELDVAVVPAGRVGTDVPLSGGMLLRVYAARIADEHAEPHAVEHREARWVSAGELTDLDWLPADRALLPALRALLTAPPD